MRVQYTKMIHWLFLCTTIMVPLFFVRSLSSPFLLAKDTLLVLASMVFSTLFLFWYASREKTEVVLKKSALYLLGFLAYAFISIFWSPGITGALRAFLPLLAGALFFLGYDVFYRNEDRDNRYQLELIQAVVVIALIQSLIVLSQFLGVGFAFFGEQQGKWRVFGTFGNPNYVAEFLLPAVFLSLNLFLNEVRTIQRRFYKLAFIVCSLAIFATFSRSGLLLWFLGLLIYLFFYSRQEASGIRHTLKRFLKKGKTLSAILFTGLIVILLLIPIFRLDRTLIRHMANKTSVLGRIFIWKNSVNATINNLPFGAGIGGFPAAYAQAQYAHFEKGNTSFVNNGRLVVYAHNDALQFFVELGPGAILLLLFLWRIIRDSTRDLSRGTLSIGILIAFYSLTASSLINFPLRVAPNLYLFFLLAALVHRHRGTVTGKMMRPGTRMRKLSIFILPVFILISFFSVRFFLGGLQLKKGEDARFSGERDRATRALTLAYGLTPSNPLAAAAVAAALLQDGETEKAYRIALAGVEFRPTPRGYHALAKAATKTGRTGIALDALKKRAYTFRSEPTLSISYLRRLYADGKYKTLGQEVIRLNRSAAELNFITSTASRALQEANSLRILAHLSEKKGEVQSGYGGFRAIASVGRFIYAGTGGNGLVRFDPRTKSFSPVTNFPFRTVHTVLHHKNSLLASTESGLFSAPVAKGGGLGGPFEAIPLPVRPDSPVLGMTVFSNQLYLVTPDALIETALPDKKSSLRVYRLSGREALFSLSSIESGHGQLLIGGVGQLFNLSGTNLTAHPVTIQDPYSGKQLRPQIRSIRFLNKQLALLCTDHGLLTVFTKNGLVVRRQHNNLSLVDANFVEKELVLLDERGFLLHQNMQEFLQGINKHDLSRASVTYTEFTIKKQKLASLPETVGNSRIAVYSSPPFRNWLFAATGRGLISQPGPYGSPTILQPPGKDIPGPDIRSLATTGETLFIFDTSSLWSTRGNGFFRIMPLSGANPHAVTTKAGALFFIEGSTVYSVSSGRGPSPLFRCPNPPVALAALSNTVAVALSGGDIHVYANGALSSILKTGKKLSTLALGANRLYAGTKNSGVFVYQTGQQKPVGSYRRSDGLPDNQITSLTLSRHVLAVGSVHGGVSFINTRSGSVFPHDRTPWRDYYSHPVVFSARLPSAVGFLQGKRLILSGTVPNASLELDTSLLQIGKATAFSLWKGKLVIGGERGLLVLPGMASMLGSYSSYLGGR